MKEEIFKEIAGYEGLYEVSNLGNVRSLNYHRTGQTRILKPQKDTKCYLRVILYKDGKSKMHKVHRLVAQAFIPNPYNLPEINHIDEDKTNNRANNLEWCDRKYNINYGTRNERCSKKLLQLTLDYVPIKEWASTAECGRNGFDRRHVLACCNGKQKTHKGCRWMFAKDYYTLLEHQSMGIPFSHF